MMRMLAEKIFITVTFMFVVTQSLADEIRVAVASNFTNAIVAISAKFEATTGHDVTLIFGSTGKHYAQIKNGAPFDVFLAADVERPERLEKEGVSVFGSRFTYAIGQVVLWSPNPHFVDSNGSVLRQGKFRFLAIANPKLAPYGKAAMEVLQAHGLWGGITGRMVRGENIGQTFQFVKSGNAELGFVAYSQIKRPNTPVAGSFWKVPQILYTPIKQQGVLLNDNESTRAFLAYMQSNDALKIIRDYGYETP